MTIKFNPETLQPEKSIKLNDGTVFRFPARFRSAAAFATTMLANLEKSIDYNLDECMAAYGVAVKSCIGAKLITKRMISKKAHEYLDTHKVEGLNL